MAVQHGGLFAAVPARDGCRQICITGLPRQTAGRAIACALARPAGFPNTMSDPHSKMDAATTAKLLVILLAFAWGLNWIAAAFALREVSPWSLRLVGSSIGAVTLFAAAAITRHNLRIPRGEYVHIMIAGFLNVSAFQIFSGFAQLNGATSRAIIITYSMPIWSVLLSRMVLGEKFTAVRVLALCLCVTGLVVLV